MTRAPDQAIYDLVYARAKKLGYTVYTHTPPEGVPYPFVRMGETYLFPRATKTRLFGRVVQTVSIWGSYIDRKLVSDMACSLIKDLSRSNLVIDGTKFTLRFEATTTDLLPDHTSAEDLWQALVKLEFLIL